MSTLNIQSLCRKSKSILNYRYLLPELVPWLTLSGSNYPCLEWIPMVQKMFEPLRFDYIRIDRPEPDQDLNCLSAAHQVKDVRASAWQNLQNSMCAQRRTHISLGIRPVWSEFLLSARRMVGYFLPVERTAKTLIRLGGCPGWSESSLDAHVIL